MALAGGCRLFLKNRGSSYHQQNRSSQGIAFDQLLCRSWTNANHLRQKFGSSYFGDDSVRCGKFEKGQSMKIVAVTACPTGIAHTYMAAEQLEKTAKTLGHQIKVETQGAMGIENELKESDIRQAQVAIFAVDIEIENRERFDQIKVIRVPVQDAIKDPVGVFKRIQG